MIRVFPRKTKWTPTDNLSFIGEPGLFRPPVQPVKISCTFTWDIPECERLYRAWSVFYPDVELGGPALGYTGDTFEPGVFVKHGITFTSRGCSKQCDWCFVPKREGSIRELPIIAGNDIADNNLLACSRPHIEAVFEMLRGQKGIKFSGGLDAEMIQPWHVDLLKTIRFKYVWFACDYPGAILNLEKVADLMSDFSKFKKRCYVLIGHNGETVRQAEKRLKRVYELGFDPMAMLYKSDEQKKYSEEWLYLRRYWTRPAIYRAAESLTDGEG